MSRRRDTNGAMHDYHRLDVWMRSRRLIAEVYRATASLPEIERFGLQSQMRRAAVSVGSNIAEGAARGNGKDFRRFLRMASGSAAELETQLFTCLDVGFLERNTVASLAETTAEIRKMLYSLARSTVGDDSSLI